MQLSVRTQGNVIFVDFAALLSDPRRKAVSSGQSRDILNQYSDKKRGLLANQLLIRLEQQDYREFYKLIGELQELTGELF